MKEVNTIQQVEQIFGKGLQKHNATPRQKYEPAIAIMQP